MLMQSFTEPISTSIHFNTRRTAWLGRITYPTQSGLTLGVLGYREEQSSQGLNFGADVGAHPGTAAI